MTLTYGRTREKLIANGYVPTSAARCGAHGWRFSDDPGAVVCIPRIGGTCGVAGGEKLTVVTLNVLARDPKLRAALAAVLSKYGIAGPIRTDSAGNDAYVVRWDDDYHPPHSDEIELSPGVAAFAVGGWVKDPSAFASHESAIIRLDGEWRGGDLLGTPRAKLPGIADEDALKTIVSAVRDVIEKNRPAPVYEYKLPPPTPQKRSKTDDDLADLTAAERAPFLAGARGAISHREKARLDRLTVNGADAD